MEEILKSEVVKIVSEVDSLDVPQHLIPERLFYLVTHRDIGPSEVVARPARVLACDSLFLACK